MSKERSKKEQKFGGTWSETKVNLLKEYLQSYLNVLKKHRDKYTVVYIDGFAGTGRRYPSEEHKNASDSGLVGLSFEDLPDLSTPNRDFFEGSAQVALDLNPGFDYLVFVEQDQSKLDELRTLEEDDKKSWSDKGMPTKISKISAVLADGRRLMTEKVRKAWFFSILLGCPSVTAHPTPRSA